MSAWYCDDVIKSYVIDLWLIVAHARGAWFFDYQYYINLFACPCKNTYFIGAFHMHKCKVDV